MCCVIVYVTILGATYVLLLISYCKVTLTQVVKTGSFSIHNPYPLSIYHAPIQHETENTPPGGTFWGTGTISIVPVCGCAI